MFGKRKILYLVFSIMICMLSGCAHKHTWIDATCTEPKTCSECKETEGEPLGHTWKMADCMTPTICTVCSFVPDTQLADHDCDKWDEEKEATCQEAGFKKGICKYCAKEYVVELPIIDHSFSEWVRTTDPTCNAEGLQERTCSMCNTVENEIIAKTEHDLNDWEAKSIPEYGKDGEWIQTCKMCKETINTKPYTFAELISDQYTLKGDTEGFTITDSAVYYDHDDFFTSVYTIVEVTNTGDSNIRLSECVEEFNDDEGHLIGTLEDYFIGAYPEIIAPGEKGYFMGETVYSKEDGFDLSNGVNLSSKITINKTSDATEYYKISDASYKGNPPEALGRVTNITSSDVADARVAAFFRDESGRVINFARENIDQLAAGETSSFRALNSWFTLYNAKKVKSFSMVAFRRHW